MTAGSVPSREERVLLGGVWTGIALLLLMPFVVTPQTIFPFVVGKALYSRAIIEIVFGLWALLAIAKPSYRPPRSALLVLLAIVPGVALLAACTGVSVQRSLWSTYERMQGVVDLAHWFAFALVLVSVVRHASQWRTLLNLNLAASALMALLAIARFHGADVPFYGDLPERDWPRIAVALGNPTYLSAYLLVNILVAAGFIAQSCVRQPPSSPQPAGRRGQPGKSLREASNDNGRPWAIWKRRFFWASVAALDLWAWTLSGSLGALAGLAGGIGFLMLCLPWGRTAILRGIGLAGLLAGTVVLTLIGWYRSDADSAAPSSLPLLQRLIEVDVQDLSIQARVNAWDAGLKGFADAPLLGWGPENYLVVFGRHASGQLGKGVTWIHDYAHGKFIEELATKGLLGISSYLALWLFAFFIVARAVRTLDAKARILPLFVGAALAAEFVRNQFLFETATGSLQCMLLLAFVAHLETVRKAATPDRERWRFVRHIGVRAAVAAATAATVGIGIVGNYGAYAAADAIRAMVSSNDAGRIRRHFERAVASFGPLANTPRLHLFQVVRDSWPELRLWQGDEPTPLLELADAEAARAVADEPDNWMIHVTLAQMYAQIATTDAGYREAARHHREQTLQLVPRADGALSLLRQPRHPGTIRAPRQATGSYTLYWPSLPSALTYQLEESSSAVPGWVVAYDGIDTSTTLSGRRDGEHVYRVRGCVGPENCSRWSNEKTVRVTSNP